MAAATAGVLLLATGAGCAKAGKPRTSLAPAPLAPGVAPVGSVGPAEPTVVPNSGGSGQPSQQPQPSQRSPRSTAKPPPGGGSGGGGGVGGGGGGGSTPTSPPPPPPPVHNDYSVVTTGKCFWSILYDAGNNDLMAGAEFTITYRGDQANPTSAPITITTNPSDGYHSDGDVPLGTRQERTGGQMYQVSPFLGQHITVTATLNVTDEIASDNAASITVSMPTLAEIQSVGLDPSTSHQTACG